MYLLDTNVLSELRRTRPHGAVLAWIDARRAVDLFTSAICIGELQRGAELIRSRDPARADQLEAFIDRCEGMFHVLAVDAKVARSHARMMMGLSDDLYDDGLIAATAHVHALSVVTRNTSDFARFPVSYIDPWSATAPKG